MAQNLPAAFTRGLSNAPNEVLFDKLVVAPDYNTVLVTMSREQVAANPEFSGNDPPQKPTAAPPARGPSNALNKKEAPPQ
jgi:hypothetical protein